MEHIAGALAQHFAVQHHIQVWRPDVQVEEIDQDTYRAVWDGYYCTILILPMTILVDRCDYCTMQQWSGR